MSLPHLQERATACLSSSLLPLVTDPERVDSLKAVVGTFVHRTRNLLNGIKMSLYILRRGSTGSRSDEWAELERVYGAVETLLDRLQMIYKSRGLTTIHCPLGQLIRDCLPGWRGLLARRGLVLDVAAPTNEDSADFDPASFTQGLDAFVSWRAEVAARGSRILLGWRINGDNLELWWKEDAPECEQAEESLALDGTCVGVDTLALPLLARITALHGGGLEARRNPDLCVTIRWPRFHRVDGPHA